MKDTNLQRIKHLVKQVSGAAQASAVAQHVGQHLQNVERWAQHEFFQQRQAHESRLAELERRVHLLEKSQKALISAGSIEHSPKAEDAVDLIAVSSAYFQQATEILSEVQAEHSLFAESTSVFELYCGAAKSARFLADRVSRYVGVEPSATLRAAARREVSDSRFSFVDMSEATALQFQADVVVLIAEKQRWAIHDIETLLGVAEAHLSPRGSILLHIPYSFSDLSEAGWNLNACLAALALNLHCSEQRSSHGSYVLIKRNVDV